MKSVWSKIRAKLMRVRESMREIPDITASSSEVVVDAITQRRSVLRFFGERVWIVTWRSVQDPDQRVTSRLHREMRAGSAMLGDGSFSFIVRWRGDLRRKPLRVRHALDDDMVTPVSVMQLARLTSGD